MKFIFLLLLTLAVVFGVPIQETTEKKSNLTQGEGLPEQGPVVQEQPTAEQDPVVQEQPTAEQGPVVQEQPTAEQGPVVQEQPVAEQGPVVQEQPVAEQGPVVQEQPVAEQGPVVQEQPADEPLPEDDVMDEEEWEALVRAKLEEGHEMEEEPKMEARLEEPQMEEGLWEGPMVGEEWPMVGEEKQLSPVTGGIESLKRLAEMEELPERSTVLRNDMEPLGEKWPMVGAEPFGITTNRSRSHTEWQNCGGVVINGICYQFFRGPKKAVDSEFFCQDNFRNGHLASVTSRYIHQQMMRLMVEGGGYTRTWIGGLRYLQTERFIWLDGSHWNYVDWLPGEPNNTAGVEDCVELLSNGYFNDMPCWDLRAFICSYHV